MWNPRVGGEKATSREAYDLWLGSPPHGRGKAKERNVQLNLTRITPAWAGKSYGTDGKMPWLWDHPRVGGEKSKHCRASTSLVGSPPRGRGKANDAGQPTDLQRDHPRVGGEK